MRTITATAPIRICDVGGWTDTWFAGHGRVLNIAVTPAARAVLRATPDPAGDGVVEVHAEALGRRYRVRPGDLAPGGVPIVDAAIRMLPPPDGLACELEIGCDVPPGASTGTSAAVAVAVLGALARLRGADLEPGEAAERAYDIETRELGRESGVQDQIAAAFGGINAITIEAFPERLAFPTLTVRPLALARSLLDSLERRLVLLYLGHGHESSAIHHAVIAGLADAGPHAPALVRLREAALEATAALEAGDLAAFGRALVANTGAQMALHPLLVSQQVRRLIEVARAHGAAGWKVNGAGGDGGTLSVLAGDDERRATLVAALSGSDPRVCEIPLTVAAPGLRVGEVTPAEDAV